MSDLPEFLLARIAEDEADARLATTNGGWDSEPPLGPEWTTDAAPCGGRWFDALVRAGDTALANPYQSEGSGIVGQCAPHIARHDPARVLAECEAKRRIVETRPAISTPGSAIHAVHDEVQRQREYVFRLLALPYADHEDYRQEWRP